MIANCLATLLALSPICSAAQVGHLPYQDMANLFRADNGIQGSPGEVKIEEVLANNFFSAQVGIFEVWIPNAGLENKTTCKDFKGVCTSLVEAQERWIDWLGVAAQGSEALRDDLSSHQAWIKKWKTSALGHRKPNSATDALTFFEAEEAQKEVSKRLSESMRSGSILGLKLEKGTAPVRLVIMPERKQFVEFLAFAGWWKPALRKNYWTRGIQNWTEFRIDDLQVIALQHPATSAMPDEYSGSSSMKATDPSGLEQQVVQLGTNQLLAYIHGDSMPSPVLRSLSIQMLIEIYGSCHTRNDGDMRGRRTNARSMFVAGGMSSGGRLAKNLAENRWRTDYGKHHYRRILKSVQKGGKAADKGSKHKYRAFLIDSNSEKENFVLRAPIFNPLETNPPVPPGFEGDHAEFTRAYYVSFMHWLQYYAGGSKPDSAALFAEVISKLTSKERNLEFGQLLESVYSMPMVNDKLDTDCIEGKYLKWIAKG